MRFAETNRAQHQKICEKICPMCATKLQLIWVHGHGQCSKCGINIEPCCSGAPLPDQKS